MGTMKMLLDVALNQGQGVLRLFPTWVPRSFCIPGKRLKLHPDDYYAFGVHRGGIDERWFASTVQADNGPETLPDEGLSYIYVEDGGKAEKILLRDAIELAGDAIVGKAMMEKYGGWPMFAKFFDNLNPLFHHVHHDDEKAKRVGRLGKPEGYYFPPQLNNHGGYFPYTFFGLNPGTKKEDVLRCLERWDKGDNGILYLSRAYKLKPGTGWIVQPGILHAPGSLLTYEPQKASDVFAPFQNIVWDRFIPWDLVVKDVPPEHKNDLEYIVSLLDWEANTDPDFFARHYLEPKPVRPLEEMRAEGYEEYYVVYGSEDFSAKELTVFPGRSVTIREDGPYGVIVVQGHGKFGALEVEAPTLIRFGEMTRDELFVTYEAARAGVTIVNESATENLVMLKHFGPKVE